MIYYGDRSNIQFVINLVYYQFSIKHRSENTNARIVCLSLKDCHV